MNPKEQREVFSANLNRLIAKTGKSKAQVADELEVAKTTLSNWCTNISVPNWAKIRKIADYFNVSPNKLVEPYDPKAERMEMFLEEVLGLDDSKFDMLYSYLQFLTKKEGD